MTPSRELVVLDPGVEVSLAERTLDELAEIVEREHESAENAFSSALGHALKAGAALLEVRRRVPTNEWRRWVESNLTVTRNTADRYLRLATYRDEIATAADIESAVRVLAQAGLTRARVPIEERELRLEVFALREQGLTQRAIAERLGVARSTVVRCFAPEQAREAIRRQGQRRRKNHLLAELARREEIARRARAGGGSVARAYSLIRQLAQELDAAHATEGDLDAKRALREALTAVYRSEDKIAEALGVTTPRAVRRES